MHWKLLVTAAVGALASSALAFGPGCSGTSPCTPEEHDLEGATRLALRVLPGRESSSACAEARVALIASEAELRTFYEGLGVAPADQPTVDFSRERVIVSESSKNEAINWAVVRGETGVVGLLGCTLPSRSTCVTQVRAVSSLITKVESRTCDPVHCGQPALRNPPGRS